MKNANRRDAEEASLFPRDNQYLDAFLLTTA